ncbi:MAG: MarR family transcriptional regulator [Hyphomicrobiaceae bacterium TMED74]|nr:MarR family transcriptional regulator [Filomicrobium sp.]RPG39869.1 MAG: MarR family transcriptional regulator [Hyphomicrobiaceae bacterium TMED74]
MSNDDDAYLTRSLGFLLGDVSRLVRMRFDQRARDLDLTRAQWRVLAQLRRREGINQRALADILDIENITLTRHVDRLELKGLVERRPDPNDRRARTLHLKDKAKSVLGELRTLSEQTREEALTGISQEESEQLIDTLLRIKENMSNLETPNSKAVERRQRSRAMVGGDQ